MGVCHSACGSRSYEYEYYNEAYRHQIRHRARAKLVGESLASEDGAASSKSRHVKQKRLKRASAGYAASGTARRRHPTQLWMCDQGCCSIRWKLDYAEFQSYTVYAQVSPYVVVQDKTGKCACVICKGLSSPQSQSSSQSLSQSSASSSPLSSASFSGRGQESPAVVVRKACESHRLSASVLQGMLPAAAASFARSPLTSPSLAQYRRLPSDGSVTDDDDEDDDDGSI